MPEDFLDDNVVIPDWIKKMSPEERRAEIKRLEKEEAEYAKAVLKKQAN